MTTTIVSVEDYFGPWINHHDVTDKVRVTSFAFLQTINEFLQAAIDGGVILDINPRTKTYVAGETYGGFRPQACPQGKPESSHKEGCGVDIYDPDNELDEFCMLHQPLLKMMFLHIEHPDATIHWCHLTNRAPKSGNTVFYP